MKFIECLECRVNQKSKIKNQKWIDIKCSHWRSRFGTHQSSVSAARGALDGPSLEGSSCFGLSARSILLVELRATLDW